VDGVVDERVPEVVVVPLADRGVLEALLVLGVVGQRQLVELGLASVIGQLGELDRDVQARRRGVRRSGSSPDPCRRTSGLRR
jgi:hypothetical protein